MNAPPLLNFFHEITTTIDAHVLHTNVLVFDCLYPQCKISKALNFSILR